MEVGLAKVPVRHSHTEGSLLEGGGQKQLLVEIVFFSLVPQRQGPEAARNPAQQVGKLVVDREEK